MKIWGCRLKEWFYNYLDYYRFLYKNVDGRHTVLTPTRCKLRHESNFCTLQGKLSPLGDGVMFCFKNKKTPTFVGERKNIRAPQPRSFSKKKQFVTKKWLNLKLKILFFFQIIKVAPPPRGGGGGGGGRKALWGTILTGGCNFCKTEGVTLVNRTRYGFTFFSPK